MCLKQNKRLIKIYNIYNVPTAHVYKKFDGHDSLVSLLQAGGSVIQNPMWAIVSIYIQTSPEAHPASYQIGTKSLSLAQTTHTLLTPRVRVCGAIPLLLPCSCFGMLHGEILIYINY
jgi:hypothetical protein